MISDTQEAWIVYNVGTGSPVSHQSIAEQKAGSPPISLIWPTRKEAARHAYNLYHEYAILHPQLVVRDRSWNVRLATQEEKALALTASAFGTEWQDIIGVGQSRPEGTKPRDNVEGEGDEIERFRDSL